MNFPAKPAKESTSTMGKITFSELELSRCRPEHYPRCFSHLKSFDHFFLWGDTRQGDSYWRDKFRVDLDKLTDSEYHSSTIPSRTLSYEDRLYLSLLCFAKKHHLVTIHFSPGCSVYEF
jgi:hypothetical protein